MLYYITRFVFCQAFFSFSFYFSDDDGNTLSDTANKLREVIEKRKAAFDTQLQSCAGQILKNMLLWDYKDLGCSYYRFIAFDANCKICQELDGKTFRVSEGKAGENLSPIHPNCDCATAILDDDGAIAFVVCKEEELREASKRFDKETASLFSSEKDSLESTKKKENGSRWYAPILRIPSDALQMFREYANAQNIRLQNAGGNPLKLLDWLLLGIPSSFWNGMQQRTEEMLQEPTLYHISNYLSMGAVEPIKGAAFPEERFSLQHLLDSFHAAGTVFGGYRLKESLFPVGESYALPKDPEKRLPNRPTWRKSELDTQTRYLGYAPQKSFKDGIEVTCGTKGSSKPDFYKPGHSIEVKNYSLKTKRGQSNLVNNVSRQVNSRIKNLPIGTKQHIVVDIRGQIISGEIMKSVRRRILEKCKVKVTIYFRRR